MIFLEYLMLDGYCRTEEGGTGDVVEIRGQTKDQCRQRCNELSTCVAFEFDSGTGRCETHSKGTTTSNGGPNNFKCYIRREGKKS